MIKDQIIKGNLTEFNQEYSYNNLSEDDSFEHYVNFLLFTRFNSEIFDDRYSLEKINVDNGQNFGIDGVGFMINNTFVFNEENIQSFINQSLNYPSLNLDFVFTQAKTSSKFDAGDVLKFITAVKAFFKADNETETNPDLLKFSQLKDRLLSYETLNSVNKSLSPNCHLFYVTTGKQADDELLLSIIKSQKEELEEANPIFKNINITLIGREELIKYYQEHLNQVEARVVFNERKDLGEIKGVGKAFLGYIKASEYLKLIMDDKENFRRNIFYENVRDFKGIDNKVNKDIAESLSNNELKDKFVLLNNGVTIVAQMVDTNYQAGEIKISNYQIVNGCQTSNVIYLNKDKLTDEILVPLKLIECSDNDITSDITKGTNNQNPVPEEAFIALEKFPKKLQSFFESKSLQAPEKIYYERRAREYAYKKPRIVNHKIFHLHKLIRAVIAMFANQPHSCHRYPGELYKQTKSSIFGADRKLFTENQSEYPYYVGCYTWFQIEKLFLSGIIHKKYKPYKYHLFLCIRLFIDKNKMKAFDRISDTQKHCDKLLKEIWDDNSIKSITVESCKVIDQTIADTRNISFVDKPRSSEFTKKIIEKITNAL